MASGDSRCCLGEPVTCVSLQPAHQTTDAVGKDKQLLKIQAVAGVERNPSACLDTWNGCSRELRLPAWPSKCVDSSAAHAFPVYMETCSCISQRD